MKKLFTISIFLLTLNSISAQDMARVRKTIDTLTSKCMAGRGYENEGDKIAAKYIQNRYKENNLLSFKDSTYYQYFKFDVNLFHFALLSVDEKKLSFGKDFLIHPASSSAKKCLNKIMYVDSLIFTNEKCKQNFLKKNLEKYALVFPSSYNKKIFSQSKSILEKFLTAGCLIELVDTKLVFSVSTYQYPVPYYQVKKEFFENKKVKKIMAGTDAYLEENYQSQNVIGFIKGKTKPDSFIVISAHYDHLGSVGGVYFSGANDNASGVSMMLELAKHYSENQPEYSIAFMAFSAEEAGLIGSSYYVKNPLFPLGKIKFLINLDLLGTGDDGITVVNATKHPQQFDLLTKINEEKKYLPTVKKRGPAANSDHYYFSEKGVPSFFIYTLGGIAAYHDIYDRPETLPLTKYSEVFQLLTSFIKELK